MNIKPFLNHRRYRTFCHCVSVNITSINTSRYFIIFLILKRNALLIVSGNRYSGPTLHSTGNTLQILPEKERDRPKVISPQVTEPGTHAKHLCPLPYMTYPQAAFFQTS